MVLSTMGGRWTTYRIRYSYFPLLILVLSQGCSSLNLEGSALLDFQARISHDPYGAFASWNANDHDPCSWSHVHCEFGNVQTLDLKGLSLEGVLAPELGNLTHLRSLVLSHNHFSGVIPKEIGELNMLEVLDLRDNQLIGNIPSEVETMQSLKYLLLCNNHLEGMIPQESESLNEESTFTVQKAKTEGTVTSRKLVEQPTNLASTSSDTDTSAIDHILEPPSTRSTGSSPSITKETERFDDIPSTSAETTSDGQSTESQNNSDMRRIMIGMCCGSFLIIASMSLSLICQNPAVKTIGPWRPGLNRQLQKAFVTGVQKLDRTELETACEGFSNIIEPMEGCTLYKGTLSSGVEICVASTTITRLKDWSKSAQLTFHNKIEMLSRVNHKNFVNLIGYCEEDKPFCRMMVFEYTPSGSLSDNLHVQGLEHLDWSARMRIIVGVGYCLQCMHDLNPPVVHMDLNSKIIYLTSDYAAKVADFNFWKEFSQKDKILGVKRSKCSTIPDKETNIYSFGVLLLEIISGKHIYSDKQERLVNWDNENVGRMIDPTLKSFNQKELDVVCEVIRDCVQKDGSERPTINKVTRKLRDGIGISPEQAIPRLSPLWWAELEILSEDDES